MKVLVLHSELGVLRGGGENFTRNLFTAFTERGHSVSAAFVADRDSYYPCSLPVCIEPILVPGWWSRKLGQTMLSSIGRWIPSDSRLGGQWDFFQRAICWRTVMWHNRRFQKRIEHDLQQRWNDFDAVYVHGDPLLASCIARQCPTVLRLPGPVAPGLEPVLRMTHAVCSNGDALVQLRRFLGDKAIELPVGLNTDLFRPGSESIRSALGWEQKHRVVGYVGRLTHLKGVDLLASAFKEVCRTLVDARLLIVGTGEEERRIRSILGTELARRIIHLESGVDHQQISQWYRAMDVIVMPSRYENISNALLEAMACGIPFVASDIGGNSTLGETGAGWLFEPGSATSLSKCLAGIINNPAEMKARGQVGSRVTRQRYSWATSAERLEGILVSCCRAKS